MRPLTKERLDSMGCSNPDCTHTAHGPMFLNGRCHLHAYSKAWFRDGNVHVHCAVCDDEIAVVAVLDLGVLLVRSNGPPDPERGTILFGCCSEECPVEVSYNHGLVMVCCAKCKSPIAQGTVKSDPVMRRRLFLGGM